MRYSFELDRPTGTRFRELVGAYQYKWLHLFSAVFDMSSKKREVLHTQARTMIASVLHYFEKEKNNGGPLIEVRKVMQRAADACGISLRSVERVKAEIKKSLETQDLCNVRDMDVVDQIGDGGCEDGDFSTPVDNRRETVVIRTPKRNSKRKRPTRDIDDFDKAAIRRHIMAYYARKEVPTLNQLLTSLRESGLYSGSRSSLHLVIQDVGFTYKKFNNRKVIMEKPSVALQRCVFLRKMRNFDITKVIFLDETWLNANGKGKRLIICHAGGVNGWIKAPPLIFVSKKTGDYHEDMDGDVFESWFFGKLLPVIPKGSTILMDNASYHSRTQGKAPTSSSTKAVMVNWLNEKRIPFPEDLRKPELYQLVRLHKPPTPTYVIDKKAGEMGFKVIRLPPYHCQYNAIEMVWASLKKFVKSRNTTFKLSDVEQLFRESISNYTADMWSKCVNHVKKLIDADWKNERLDESSVEQFIISLAPDDSDGQEESDYDSEEGDIGCAPLE